MSNQASVKNVEKLTPDDLQRMRDEKAQHESQLEAIRSKETGTAVDGIDEGIVRRNLSRTEAIIAKDEALIAKGREKDKIAREAKELEKELLENMITRNEAWPARMGTMDSERAIQKQMRFETHYGEKARRWQNLQRRLNPDDPNAGNLDRIRPDR